MINNLTLTSLSADYIVQVARYLIFEEYGCNPAVINAGLAILLIKSWVIIFPIISIVFYCREYSCALKPQGLLTSHKSTHFYQSVPTENLP